MPEAKLGNAHLPSHAVMLQEVLQDSFLVCSSACGRRQSGEAPAFCIGGGIHLAGSREHECGCLELPPELGAPQGRLALPIVTRAAEGVHAGCANTLLFLLSQHPPLGGGKAIQNGVFFLFLLFFPSFCRFSSFCHFHLFFFLPFPLSFCHFPLAFCHFPILAIEGGRSTVSSTGPLNSPFKP